MSNQCVERTRDILSEAAGLLGDNAVAPLSGRADLEASDHAWGPPAGRWRTSWKATPPKDFRRPASRL